MESFQDCTKLDSATEAGPEARRAKVAPSSQVADVCDGSAEVLPLVWAIDLRMGISLVRVGVGCVIQ